MKALWACVLGTLWSPRVEVPACNLNSCQPSPAVAGVKFQAVCCPCSSPLLEVAELRHAATPLFWSSAVRSVGFQGLFCGVSEVRHFLHKNASHLGGSCCSRGKYLYDYQSEMLCHGTGAARSWNAACFLICSSELLFFRQKGKWSCFGFVFVSSCRGARQFQLWWC